MPERAIIILGSSGVPAKTGVEPLIVEARDALVGDVDSILVTESLTRRIRQPDTMMDSAFEMAAIRNRAIGVLWSQFKEQRMPGAAVSSEAFGALRSQLAAAVRADARIADLFAEYVESFER
jgi:hypothetical protein